MDVNRQVPELAVERERSPEPLSWEKFTRPLTLKLADEGGAMFVDEQADEAWYLDLNEMTFRPLAEGDLHEVRAEHYQPYSIPEGAGYENGAKAAMEIRRMHLEEQIKVLDALQKGGQHQEAAKAMIDGIMEELGFVLAYLVEKEPRELALLTDDLNEIYKDMRAPDAESEALAAK